jgi:hypothetical protein
LEYKQKTKTKDTGTGKLQPATLMIIITKTVLELAGFVLCVCLCVFDTGDIGVVVDSSWRY